MKTFSRSDSIHKGWMFKVLSEIAEDSGLVNLLAFKGGTCAAMLGYLDRFSVDLDFDLLEESKLVLVRERLEEIFENLGLEIKDQSKNTAQYFLRYPSEVGMRSILKLDCTFPAFEANKYERKSFLSIKKVLNCQTIDTMFSNKLVALIDRYKHREAIAGRDLYDIAVFFRNDVEIKEDLIRERTGKELAEFLVELREFVENKVSQKIIDEDLNMLLRPEEFKKVRKYLKMEVLGFLDEER